MKCPRRTISFVLLIAAFSLIAAAQADPFTNGTVVKMVKAGLSDEVIATTIRRSAVTFDVSPAALLTLKEQGVSNELILAMIETHDASSLRDIDRSLTGYSESGAQPVMPEPPRSPKQMVLEAKTIALEKSSAQPSRQALEKELLKRPEWKGLGLTIHRYKDKADLFVEIGYVSMSWITHRYVYRIYDRRSGTVIAAGETTSWGSLAENLAKHIARSLAATAGS
ncbi:MAG: hypothetical protein AB7Q37_10225 [Pyrinomonadaceae bacterium]